MDELIPIIEHIASLSAKTEEDKWLLAESIYEAFVECGQYADGLLTGIHERTKYTKAQIYNYRNAGDLANWFGRNKLSVSHYARMHRLKEKYNLAPGDIMDYFSLVETENLSVDKMAQEIEQNHEPDPTVEFERHWVTMLKKMRYIQNDPLFSHKVPPITRAVYYDLVKELEEL